MNIHIVNDIIPKEQQDHLETQLLSNLLPLHLNTKSVHLDNKTAFWDANTQESFRLIHCFVDEGKLVSNHWLILEQLALAIVQEIGLPPKVASCKLNINFPVLDYPETNYLPLITTQQTRGI